MASAVDKVPATKSVTVSNNQPTQSSSEHISTDSSSSKSLATVHTTQNSQPSTTTASSINSQPNSQVIATSNQSALVNGNLRPPSVTAQILGVLPFHLPLNYHMQPPSVSTMLNVINDLKERLKVVDSKKKLAQSVVPPTTVANSVASAGVFPSGNKVVKAQPSVSTVSSVPSTTANVPLITPPPVSLSSISSAGPPTTSGTEPQPALLPTSVSGPFNAIGKPAIVNKLQLPPSSSTNSVVSSSAPAAQPVHLNTVGAMPTKAGNGPIKVRNLESLPNAPSPVVSASVASSCSLKSQEAPSTSNKKLGSIKCPNYMTALEYSLRAVQDKLSQSNNVLSSLPAPGKPSQPKLKPLAPIKPRADERKISKLPTNSPGAVQDKLLQSTSLPTPSKPSKRRPLLAPKLKRPLLHVASSSPSKLSPRTDERKIRLLKATLATTSPLRSLTVKNVLDKIKMRASSFSSDVKRVRPILPAGGVPVAANEVVSGNQPTQSIVDEEEDEFKIVAPSTCARTVPLYGNSCARVVPLYGHKLRRDNVRVSAVKKSSKPKVLTKSVDKARTSSVVPKSRPTLLKKPAVSKASTPMASKETNKVTNSKQPKKRKQTLMPLEAPEQKKACTDSYIRRMASLNASARVSALMEPEKKLKLKPKSISSSPEGIERSELERLAKTGKYVAIHYSPTGESEIDLNMLGLLYNGSTVHPSACKVFFASREEGGLIMPKLIIPLLIPYKKETVEQEIAKALEQGVKGRKRVKSNNGWSPIGNCIKAVEYRDEDGDDISRQYFIGIQRKDDKIFVRDTVSLSAGEGQQPYLGKISGIWREDGELNMTLFWYYRHEEVDNPAGLKFQPNEVLASQHHDVNSVACIEDKVYILGMSDYCRYKAASQGPLSRGGVPVDSDNLLKELVFADPSLVYLCYRGYNHITGRIM